MEQLTAFVQILLAGRRGTGDEIVGTDIQSGRFLGQWSCLFGNSHRLRSSEGAVSLVVPQRKPALIVVLGPVRVANEFQSEAAFRAVVFVSQFLADDKLKSGAVAPLDGVCVLSDDTLENPPVVVAAEPRRFRVVCDLLVVRIVELVFGSEERPPCLTVCRNHLLGGGRTENAFVLAFELAGIGVPHVTLKAVFVVVPHQSLVVDFVPERGRSVQQLP